MTADFALRFNDFSGGDFGQLDPASAENNQYRGTNVTVYDTGLIGPRAGLKAVPITGLPTHTHAPGPKAFSTVGNRLLIVLDRLYQIPLDTLAAAAQNTYPTSAANSVRFARANNNVLYSLKDGVVYKHVGVATAAISAPATFSDIVFWQQWLVGIDATAPDLIWFTELTTAGSNFDVWPANNFLYVGGNEPITALLPIYNTLYAGKAEGWWAISGILGIQAAVRAISLGNGPLDSRRSAVTTDNRIIYWPNQDSPATFNGESVRIFTRHKLRQAQSVFPSDGIAVTPTHQKVYMAGNADAVGADTDLYELDQGRWSYLSLNRAIGGITPSDPRNGTGLPSGVIFTVNNPTTIGDPVIISSLRHDLDRPAHTSDAWASPTDPGETKLLAGSFDLKAWYDSQGRQVRVKSVIVQFRKWTSGVTNSLNRFSMRVDAHGGYESGTSEGQLVEWYEPSERATDAGVDDSWRVNFNTSWGNGFQVKFPDIAGCAIREVIVLVDIRTTKTG